MKDIRQVSFKIKERADFLKLIQRIEQNQLTKDDRFFLRLIVEGTMNALDKRRGLK